MKISTKKYEIEEEIEVVNEDGETIDKLTMQITPEELKIIESIILNKEGINKSKELDRLSKKEGNEEELEKKQNEFAELIAKAEEKFEKIVFKDKLESFKKNVGKYYYEETLSNVYSFFWNSFIDKRAKQVNTMSSDLRKITQR